MNPHESCNTSGCMDMQHATLAGMNLQQRTIKLTKGRYPTWVCTRTRATNLADVLTHCWHGG